MLRRIGQLVFNGFGTKLISVVIAIVLWLVVLSSRTVEIEKKIAIELITPSDLVAANDIPETVTYRLSMPKPFQRSIQDRPEDPIRVNLSNSKQGLVTYRFYSDSVRLPFGVKVLSINPNAMLIKLEPVRQRTVAVKVEAQGLPPEGYRIRKIDVIPPTAKIKGARSRVGSIAEIPTIPIDVSELRKNYDQVTPLDIARFGVQLDGPLPRVVIEIEAVLSYFRLRNIPVQVKSSHQAKLSVDKVTLIVQATPDALREFEQAHVTAEVDLSGKPKGKFRQRFHVNLPTDIQLIRIVPPLADVTLY